jgi:hypothetical protein
MKYYDIDLSSINTNIKNVYLVLKILDIQNDGVNEFKSIIVNEKILNMIDSINFIYIKDGLEPTDVIKKVGYLLNLEVYIDPLNTDNVVIFNTELKVTVILNVKI